MSNIAVDLLVPDNATPDAVNTVTLIILGTEIKEKSVYLYVKGSLSKVIVTKFCINERLIVIIYK